MSALCPHCSAELAPAVSRCTRCNSALDPLLAPGDRIDNRYQVITALSLGPLGATYQVRDLADDVEVALNLLANELCPRESEASEFLSRMEAIAGRTIAGCAMPLAVGNSAAGAYVTSPIIDGVRLRDVLDGRRAHNRPLRVEESLRALLSLSASLAALHSVTPHGALSVDTVMITTRGLILIDNAIAVALAPERVQLRVARFASAFPYMAPEVARGKPLNAVADLYAVGAIAAEFMSGEPSLAGLEQAKLDATIDGPIRWLLDPDPEGRSPALAALLDSMSTAAGFSKRPSPGPLPVPEIPAPTRYSVPPAAMAELGATSPPPISRPEPENVVTVAVRLPRASVPPPAATRTTTPTPPAASVTPRPPSIPPRAPSIPARAPGAPSRPSAQPRASTPPRATAQPRATESARSPSVPPPGALRDSDSGRLSPPTASVPVASRVLGSSGPPGGLERSRSGPPSRRPPPPEPAESGIDPRLLRAAKRLDAERQADEDEEIDSNEIEVIED